MKNEYELCEIENVEHLSKIIDELENDKLIIKDYDRLLFNSFLLLATAEKNLIVGLYEENNNCEYYPLAEYLVNNFAHKFYELQFSIEGAYGGSADVILHKE